MKKVALVTGDTCGIGQAISIQLQKAGYTAIGVYNNDEKAAQDFTKETGIPTCQFDVSDFKSCDSGVEAIVKKHDPIGL